MSVAAIILDQDVVDEILGSPEGPVGQWLLRKAIDVETVAKRFCPVDTGRLRSSITHYLTTDELGDRCAYVGSNVEYAIYQEEGTWVMSAQPYLRPALQSVMGGISTEAYKQAMGLPT